MHPTMLLSSSLHHQSVGYALYSLGTIKLAKQHVLLEICHLKREKSSLQVALDDDSF